MSQTFDPDPIAIAALLVGTAGLAISLESQEAKRSPQHTSMPDCNREKELSHRCAIVSEEYRRLRKFWNKVTANNSVVLNPSAQTKSGFGSMRMDMSLDVLMRYQTKFSRAMTSVDIINRQLTEIILMELGYPDAKWDAIKEKIDALKTACNQFHDSSRSANKKLASVKKILRLSEELLKLFIP